MFFPFCAALRHKAHVFYEKMSAELPPRKQHLSKLLFSERDRHIRADCISHHASVIGADARRDIDSNDFHVFLSIDPPDQLPVCALHISRKTDPEDCVQNHAPAASFSLSGLSKRLRRDLLFHQVRQIFRRHHRDSQPFYDIQLSFQFLASFSVPLRENDLHIVPL